VEYIELQIIKPWLQIVANQPEHLGTGFEPVRPFGGAT